MLKLSCPACGAEILFKSSVSVFGVCTYCKSMVVRQDMNLEALGKMAQLPSDMSPFQVGTRGSYETKQFELVGRMKIGWEEGTWNEWYALFDDGRDGWLAEAQGFLMISFQTDDIKGVPALKDISAGNSVSLGSGKFFQVDDIKEVTCIGSEGELPFKSPKGRKSTSVDLSGSDNQFASIDYGDEGVRVYVGRYVDFEKLNLTSLREIDGW